MTVTNSGGDVTNGRIGGINTTSIELGYISMVYLPRDVTIAIGNTHSLHSCTCHNAEASTINITFYVVIILVSIGTIETCQIELDIVASCYRNSGMWRWILVILVNTDMEFLEPYIIS